MQIDRAEVDVQPERLAQRQQAGFRTLGQRHRIPLGPANGSEKNGVGGAASRERLGRQRFARRVDGAPAEREFGEVEIVAEFRGAFLQDAHRDPHDFRADAVARQKNNFLLVGHGFIVARRLYQLPRCTKQIRAAARQNSIVRINRTVSE